jgi:hypothetical protein
LIQITTKRSLKSFLLKYLPTCTIIDSIPENETLVFMVRGMRKNVDSDWAPYYSFPTLNPEYVEILYDTEKNKYVFDAFSRPEDWVINLDQDAFISNISAILEILIEMRIDGSDYTCFPDGGQEVRFHNPLVCNPFFNIVHTTTLKRKLPPEKWRKPWSLDERKETFIKKWGTWNPYTPEASPEIAVPCTSECTRPLAFDAFEPSYTMFLNLVEYAKVKWSCAQTLNVSVEEYPKYVIPEDEKVGCPFEKEGKLRWFGTTLINNQGIRYIVHSWFARFGLTPRIRIMRDMARDQMMKVLHDLRL